MPESKLLVANRGEIACRVLAAAADLGSATVAIAPEDDVECAHTEAADELGRSIGPGSVRLSRHRPDRGDGNQAWLHPGASWIWVPG